MLAEAALLEALPEEERDLEENKQRQTNLEKRFHVKAHRRYVQREAARVRDEKEAEEMFKEDKDERTRQKEGERLRKKQKANEEQEKREREKMEGIKERIEVLERKKDWTEVIEEAKITGRERFMAEEEGEKGRVDLEAMEREWQEIAASFDVLLPGEYIHIPESLDFVERHYCKLDRAGDISPPTSLVVKKSRV